MSREAMIEVSQRYLRRELTLDDAGTQLYALMRAGHGGMSIDTIHLAPADHERAFALLGYMTWLARREVDPAFPRPASEAEFAALVTMAPDEF